MLKVITCPVILGRCSTRADGSLSLSFSTPELPPESKVAFMELQNRNCKMLLEPQDETEMLKHDIKGEFDRKSPSQRLRSVLFIMHKQQESVKPFDEWYLQWMEGLIQSIKDKLEPQHQ